MLIEKHRASERRACKVLNLNRSTGRYKPTQNDYSDLIRKRIIELASEYGRYGYRRITAMLWKEGYKVNHKRVERIWGKDF